MKPDKIQIAFKLLLLLPILFCVSCDSGDIYPKEEIKEVIDIHVSAIFPSENTDAFPESYDMLFGTFIGTSPYPTSWKIIAKPDNDTITVSLPNIPKGTTALKLCIVNKLDKKAIYTFFQYSIAGTPQQDIVIEAGEAVDLASLRRLQAQVFTPQCIQCHGGSSGSPSAGLKFTEGDSYTYLYNVPAVSETTAKNRVTPGDVSQSFLIDVLENNVDPVFKYNHSKLSSLKSDDIELMKQWILDGAKEN